jgi:Flp pilus assembly secretin CpaC
MHRTFSVPRLLGWWSLLITLMLHVGIHAASAQNALQPAYFTPGQQTKANAPVPVLQLAVGTSRTCQMTTMADLKRVENPNSRVLRLEQIPGKNNEVLLVAENPGRTQVTFIDQNDRVEVHEVFVAAMQDVKDIQKLTIKKGDQITRKLDKAAIGGVEVSVSEVVEVIAAKDPKVFTFRAIGPGTTRVTFFMNPAKTESVVYEIEVPIEDRVVQLRNLIKKIAPNDSVEVHSLIGSRAAIGIQGEVGKENTLAVLLTGTVSSAETAELIVKAANAIFPPTLISQQSNQGGINVENTRIDKLNVINQIRIGGVHQVQLEVVVAVVNRSEARNMSFSWNVNGQNWFASSLIGGPGGVTNLLSPHPGNTVASLAQTAGNANIAFGVLSNNSSFLGFLQAMRTEGLSKIISEPRVTTLSGRPGRIQSGGHVDIISSGISSSQISADFGTIVNFLPIVLGNGKIQLEIAAEVSTPTTSIPIPGAGSAGTVSFSVLKRSASVTVHLEDGQTLAIGGLIQNKIDATISRVPFLGDLPYLGAAFSSKNYTETEEEIIIMVTPRLVDPISCDKIPKYLPGRETRSPDDFELFLEGIIEAPRGPRNVSFHPGYYKGAHTGAPNIGQIPCADGSCYNRNGGGCANGNCAPGNGNLTRQYSGAGSNTPGVAMPTPSFPAGQMIPTSNFRVIPEPELPNVTTTTPPSLGPVVPTTPGVSMPARQLDTRPVLPPVSGSPYGSR